MIRHFSVYLTTFTLLFIVTTNAHANITGKVVAVLDGDTIDILSNRHAIRIRLAQIDAPEKRQAFGVRARQVLAEMTFHKTVDVIEKGRDRYGRVLGDVYTKNPNCKILMFHCKPIYVNSSMIAQGMAWVYRRYSNDPTLLKIEKDARIARRGLWSDSSPIAPWQFRRHRQKTH